jgi:hypothetical protein
MTRFDGVAAAIAQSWWGVHEHRTELQDHVWDHGLQGEEIRTHANDTWQSIHIERNGIVLRLHVASTTPRVDLVGLLTLVAQMIADE